MSDEGGFPHRGGMPPYAACLAALEECPLVIGVIDRYYGKGFDDWGPYSQHEGRAPTHAELLHALDLDKRVLIYVHDDTWNFYEIWQKNRSSKLNWPQGLEEGTLLLFEELKKRDPVPWMENFADVSELLTSLNKEFVNQLYGQFKDQQKQSSDTAAYFLEKIEVLAPELKEKIISGLSPSLKADRVKLEDQLAQIESQLTETRDTSQETITSLEVEKEGVQKKLDTVTKQLRDTGLLLARAAMKDVPWLDFIRRTMMPAQPGRVPFHHSLEVALRGYKPSGRTTPVLREVTWSKLPEYESNLHRGYNAGIIFKGSEFVPGITFTYRRRGETEPPAGQSDYFWRLPNIYFGDYLELSSGSEEPEAYVSWHDFEWQVKNPEGQKSAWIPFTYAYDLAAIDKIRIDAQATGTALLAVGKATEAVEPLRKAYVFADRMLGIEHKETLDAKTLWNRAIDEGALSKLRFRVNDRLHVVSGPHEGKSGIVVELLLRHLHAYAITADSGEQFHASDQQVERLPAANGSAG
jgi:hypothetical protein